MAIDQPVILSPNALTTVRTTSLAQLISGTVPAQATSVKYLFDITEEGTGEVPVFSGPYLDAGISFVQPNGGFEELLLPWSFQANLVGQSLKPGDILHLQFFSINEELAEVSLPTPYTISFTTIDQAPVTVPPPSGITINRSSLSLEPTCVAFVEGQVVGDFLGFNFYVSVEEGGGSRGYALMNRQYVNEPTGLRKLEAPLFEYVSKVDGVSVKTTSSLDSSIPEYSYALDAQTLSLLISTGGLPNQTYDEGTTFYFVITAVAYDSALGEVIESPYSPEISGRYITFAAIYNDIPVRNREQIVVTLLQRVYGAKRNANLMPTSVYKDLLDPISEEFADYYVIQDFLAQTESIRSLVQFDDENGDGVSDLVDLSPKKTRLRLALKIADPLAVQSIIDSFFDKKAESFEIRRKGPTPSSGKLLLYATEIPPEGLYINDGAIVSTGAGFGNQGSPISFFIRGSREIRSESKTVFYNSSTDRYEIEVDITASASGSLGNVPSGAITQVISGVDPRFRVASNSPTSGGSDRENNLHLANRTQLAIAGIDTGTRTGYLLKALSVPGVDSARVVQAGDPLMIRDMLPSDNRHIGGMVDIYIQSQTVSERQDVLAFAYEGPQGSGPDERFFVEDALNFRIRTTNANVTPSSPITSVVRVSNATRNKDYDLAGATVGLGDGDTIQLAQNSTNLAVGMATTDVLLVDYRYRGESNYVFENQPVLGVVSVVGDMDGRLPLENYSLVKLEDPLLLGNSTQSHDSIQLRFFNGLPTDSTRQVESEPYTFNSVAPIRLIKKGVDTSTLTLSQDVDGLYLYERDVDYTVGKGGQEGYTYLYLQPYSKIRDGAVVYASYTHSQNFIITYTINEALQNVQKVVDEFKHGTANAVVKGSVRNQVEILLQVTRTRGFSAKDVEDRVRTTVGNYITSLKVGQSANLDDIISLVKNVTGVKRITLPVKRMMKKNGSFILNEYLGFSKFKVFTVNASKGVTSYISVNPVLNYGTINGGGPENLFRMIYENDKPLVIAATTLEVSEAPGRGYIQADGRIIVSTMDGASPQSKEYKASYYTYTLASEEFAEDIVVDRMETLIVGSDSIKVDASLEDNTTGNR